ncbi:MAG: FMN-binding protein [Candidatus Riflebacteria bacterium]|nr:FMN-binding protein [Candidatus Riflebacteria bacterium]
MSGKTVGFRDEIKFMLVLATVCAVLLLVARAGVGSRADLSMVAITSAGQICKLELPEEPVAAVAAFNEHFVSRTRGRIQLWQSLSRSNVWLCQARGAGMWAELALLFAYDHMHRRIIGMRVIEQNETAGLGDRIGEEAFYEQFDDMDAGSGVEMKAIRVKGNQFDAISGATITSRAVETVINRALGQIEKIASAAPPAAGKEARP